MNFSLPIPQEPGAYVWRATFANGVLTALYINGERVEL